MPKKRKSLYLIDGHALAYRTYFALTAMGGDSSRWITKTGEPTAGTYGFASVLLKILEQDRPDYLAVSFDLGHTFRDDLYADYKGTRAKMPDELSVQIDRINDLVAAFNIPILTADGYEADDVLGTVARLAVAAGAEVKVVTGDRDLLQLAGEHITINLAGQKLSEAQDYGPAEVKARYGLSPRQYVDFKALVGDKSDNIPGVSGIGEKTAGELVQKYGSLEDIYTHLDEIPARFRNKLEAGRDAAFLSLKLSTIITDVPLTFELEKCRTGRYDRQRLFDLFRTLEFNSLLRRLPADSAPPAEPAEPAGPGQQMALFTAPAAEAVGRRPAPPHVGAGATQSITVADEAGLEQLVQALLSAPCIAFDVETTAPDAIQSKLVGISLAVKEGEGYYIPVGHVGDGVQQLPLDQVLQALRPALTDPRLPKVGHNLKFDYTVLARHGLEVTPLTFDTMLAEWLCDPASHSLGLKKLVFVRLGVEMTEIKDLIGSGKKQISMDRVPIEAAAAYAAADADMTLRLKPILEAELEEKGQTWLLREMEMPLVTVLAHMEMAGILLDREYLAAMSAELEQQLSRLEADIYKLVGHEFNLNSTQQLADALYSKLQLRPVDTRRKTASGSYSTAADVLEELRGRHPVIDRILEQRELSKLRSTYVDALPAAVNPETGRVHTSYKQTGSVTGRIASESPNLQNIPIRTELGRRVRQAFIAARGWRLLSADYSQIELRIAAHVSKDPTLLEAFRRGEDIHAATAAAVLGVQQDKVTKDQRRIAKCVAVGTLVYTTEGLLPIEALAGPLSPGEYRPIELQIHTDCGLKAATHLYYDGIQPVRTIRLRGGIEITCTADHQLRAIDERGDYVWRRAADVRPGDHLAVTSAPRAFGRRLDLSEPAWPDDLATTNYRDLALPLRWTPEVARFLGYVVSEGYTYHHPTKKHTGAVVLSQALDEADVVADLRHVCVRLFGPRVRLYERRGNAFFVITSSKLVHWLDGLGVGGKSQAKALPDGLLQTPQPIQAEFLRALFAGDGSLKAGGRHLTYCTKSPALARQLQQMLLNFGFRFSLQAEARRDRPAPYYVLSLGGAADLQRFMDTIGVVTQRKNRVRPATRYDLSTLPYQGEHVRQLYPLLHGTARDKTYELLRPKAPVRLNRTRARLIVEQLRAAGVQHPSAAHLGQLLRLGVDFVPVEGVTTGQSEVYDLVVPDGHCYIANGFVSHNTVNFGILYGQGAFGLTRTTGMTLAEAENFIKAYFQRLPGLRQYIDATKRYAAEHGYVESLLGRRRYFPGLTQPPASREAAIARARAEREAINAPIQATAADIIKLAMLRLPGAFHEAGLKARLLLQVHDELVVECPAAEVPEVARLMCDLMEHAFKLDIPLGVDARAGKNWEEMKPVLYSQRQ